MDDLGSLHQSLVRRYTTIEEADAVFRDVYENGADGSDGRYIYSRITHPNAEQVEHQLAHYFKAPACVVFNSGMSAITTLMMSVCSSGDAIYYSQPNFAGTRSVFLGVAPRFGINTYGFQGPVLPAETAASIRASKASHMMLYVESPSNPTCELVDFSALTGVAGELRSLGRNIVIAADNTYMAPRWAQPRLFGVDYEIVSLSKFVAGHSDVLAGAVFCDPERAAALRMLRTLLGTIASPFESWLLLRSLKTLELRLERHDKNARLLIDFLRTLPGVSRLYYPGHPGRPDPMQESFASRYCTSAGAMIAFELVGGQPVMRAFLNSLKTISIAATLGSSTSIIQVPALMTHRGLGSIERAALGISEELMRLSVGIEPANDLIADIEQAYNSAMSQRH